MLPVLQGEMGQSKCMFLHYPSLQRLSKTNRPIAQDEKSLIKDKDKRRDFILAGRDIHTKFPELSIIHSAGHD